MKELYINGRLVDLDDNLIALTFAVNNLAELKDRQANFSNIFKCPLTENNRETFGYADYDSFTQDQPYKPLPAKLVQNGIEIVPNGVAIIKSAGSYFEVQVLSGIVGFLGLIESKYLTDLSFNDHVWNLETVVASQTNTEEFIYPIIDYGSVSSFERVVDVRQLRPAAFNKTVIDKIIRTAGYSYDGDVFNDPVFRKEIIPFAVDKFEHTQAYIDSIPDYDYESADPQFVWSHNDRDIIFPFETKSDPSGSFYDNEYHVQIPMKANVKLTYFGYADDVYNGGSPPSITVKLQLYRDGGWQDLRTQTHTVSQDEGRIWIGEFTNHEASPTLEDTLSLYPGEAIRVVGRSEPATDRIQAYLSPRLTVTYDKATVIYGQPVQLNMILPKIAQKDHLKDFMQRYCLTPVVDNYQKKISFKSFKNLYQNKTIARDWTEKFTADQEEAEFTIGNYAQLNWGKYKEDENVTGGLGSGSFEVDNKNLKPEVDLFTSVYSASDSSLLLEGITIPVIKKIEDSTKSLEFKTKTQPRILLNKTGMELGILFTDTTTSETPLTASIPYFSDLHFDKLFSKNYFELINYMLKKARKVTRIVLLEEDDIANLDHFIPVYDANEAKYYYLNQISDYIEGQPAKCEFIRM